MSYTPNLKNAKVLKRLRHAYGYAVGHFSEVKPQTKSKRAIDKNFGQSQHSLGKWIRKSLLICTNHHYSNVGKQSKDYILNAEGDKYIKQVLEGNRSKVFTPAEQLELNKGLQQEPPITFDYYVVSKVVELEHSNELNLKEFVYEDKSNRLWHPLQAVRGKYKKEILNKYGLKYHYDIRCCAPTLLLQDAIHHGLDNELVAINEYLSDRQYHRDRITNECELTENNKFSEKTSKIIINALFCGARLGNSPQFALSKLLNNDSARIEWLKEDEWLTHLRSDIKEMWSNINITRRKIIDKNGTLRHLPVSSRQKWNRYFELEREVLNAASDYFKKTNNKCFLEHDGWSTEKMVDVSDLKNYIKKKTTFNIEIDCEYVSDSIESKDSWTPASQCTLVNSLTLTDACVLTPSATLTHHHNNRSVRSIPKCITDVVHCNINTDIDDSPTAIDNQTWLRKYLRSRKH